MSTEQITVANTSFQITRKKIKNLYLRVSVADGSLKITAPLKLSEQKIKAFITSKLAWIEKQKIKYQNRTAPIIYRYTTGESHYYQGNCYALNVIHHETKAQVILNDQATIDLYIAENSSITQRQRIMANWYRKKIKEAIPPLLAKWQNIIGVEITDCRIKQMKTRWGTCNIKQRRIWLNLELAKKPQHCLEYIIVHELVHLLERYHNARFYAYMDRFLPQWQSYKKELNSSNYGSC